MNITRSLNHFFFHSDRVINGQLMSRLICLFCLLNMTILLPDIYNIYDANGFLTADIVNTFTPAFAIRLSDLFSILTRLGIAQNQCLLLVIAVYMLSLLSVILGYGRFLCAVAALLIHIMLVNSSYLFSYGADYLITFSLFINLLLNFPVNKNKAIQQVINCFVIRMLQIQLCLIYFFSGFGKILGTDWIDGNAVWYIMNTHAPRPVFDTFSGIYHYPVIFMLLSWGIVIAELCYPLLASVSKTRKTTVIIMIILHISIAVLMKLNTFAAIMILFNLISFSHYFTSNIFYQKTIKQLDGLALFIKSLKPKTNNGAAIE